MIKIYDSNHKFLKLLPLCKNIRTEEVLKKGFKTLIFEIPCSQEYLSIVKEENYAEIQDYSFIIKEIVATGNDFVEVHCAPNIEELTGRVFPVFDVFEQGLEQTYAYCLSKSSWSLNYMSQDRSIATYQLAKVNGYDMIKQISADYGKEIWFDTRNKVLTVYDKMGKEFGAYYSNEIYLKQLIKQSNSYEYGTVVYPIGKDGLTIKDINNGKDYLEDFSYSNKYIEKYFIDEDIDVAEKLKKEAEEYLAEICVPKASYKLSVASIGKDVGLGDTIYLVDKIKSIKQKQRVVKIVRYPLVPELDSIEISNLQVDFADQFIRGQKEVKEEIAYLRKMYENFKKS